MLPEASAKVSFRSFDPLFDPIYRDDSIDKDTDKDISIVDINAGKRGVGGETVSYTHLDVYKRQIQKIRADIGRYAFTRQLNRTGIRFTLKSVVTA